MASQRTHVESFTHGRIVGKLESGCSTWVVGNEFRVPKIVEALFWKKFPKLPGGTAEVCHTKNATRRMVYACNSEKKPPLNYWPGDKRASRKYWNDNFAANHNKVLE